MQDLLERISLTTLALALILSISDCLAAPQGEAAKVTLSARSDRDECRKFLPQVFADVLAEIKTKTHVAILLPSHLVEPIVDAKHAFIENANADAYAVSLYYEIGFGNSGFAGSFSAQAKSKYKPGEVSDVIPVKLAHGLRGFFRAVSCGGSCAPANLWWEQNGTLYQIQLHLPSTLSEHNQEKAIVNLADSSITGGPR
ncbi:MAG: hypothetical protein JOY93_06100 [Acidobacteriales bacterium]|nr:hypothetical protein [Terriglobales bacterium]